MNTQDQNPEIATGTEVGENKQTIAAAIAGYVDIHNPELRAILAKAGYSPVVIPADLDFFGVWNWDRLDEDIDEAESVVKIGGKFFTKNPAEIECIIQSLRDVDDAEKERFYKGLPLE
ncbi:hypothetical protein KGQ27_03490 [Patescibacteria group bacterium]|nr:hypothetical protein [Patescibacteria group bacterium]MDE1946916.1 hypothetical protein [Patescibacteria group bacterium]MDE2011117.1 hypothetical protein [Patescibacteria group bacterium]MDE2233191.1 hypothetical protein [Patescibacteria group bacterium]